MITPCTCCQRVLLYNVFWIKIKSVDIIFMHCLAKLQYFFFWKLLHDLHKEQHFIVFSVVKYFYQFLVVNKYISTMKIRKAYVHRWNITMLFFWWMLYLEYYSNILYFIVLMFVLIAAVFGCLKWDMKHKYMEKSTTLKTIVLVFWLLERVLSH